MTDFEHTLAEIEKAARRLVRLFDQPEPGLFTWTMAVGGEVERIAQLRVVEASPNRSVAT